MMANMGTPRRSSVRRPNETMRLFVTTFVGIVFGFFLDEHSIEPFSLPLILLILRISILGSQVSTQALLNVWSSLKANRGIAHKLNDTKVGERCRNEWTTFQDRMTAAEKAYLLERRIDPPNSTAR